MYNYSLDAQAKCTDCVCFAHAYRYFSLVVALHADTALGSFPVVAHVSERIIVRVGAVS